MSSYIRFYDSSIIYRQKHVQAEQELERELLENIIHFRPIILV